MPTIDHATFEALQTSAGADFVRDLIDTFLHEAPKMLDDLRSALAAGDATRFRRAAHSLKSNGNTFGALEFGALAKELELGGIARASEHGGEAMTGLAEEYTRVAAALRELQGA
ncbi:MAG TPA: Hpt domain-containing protein [Casimicrobiaceae bacterium]|jgi:HPt (histidine-containing phosphotransfer) domain-containing protein